MRMNLHIDEYGTGSKTIILIHGGPSLFGYMKSLGDLLKKDFKIVDYAQRGTRESPVVLEEISLDHHIEDLKNLVEKVSIHSQPILIGHSWGANLALLTVAKHKDLVEKVILLGTAALTEEISDQHAKSLNGRYTEDVKKSLIDINQRLDTSTSDAQTNKIMQERLALASPFYHLDPKTEKAVPHSDWNFQSFLKSIDSIWDVIDAGTIPRLLEQIEDEIIVFHGDYDPIPMKQTFAFLSKNIKSIKTIKVNQSGHFPWLEQSSKDSFLTALFETLK